jgi:hypothetical protein
MKLFRLNILIFFIITFCVSCEDYYNKRVVFTLQSIIVDKSVVGLGEFVNLSAIVTIQGAVNENNVKYTWDCEDGEFNDKTKQATIWTAPTDNTGEFLIRLKVSFMGNTEEGEVAIKVVRTPAGSWGSISGNIFNNMKSPLQNIIVTTKTGESDTTDIAGFFYIEDVPQGGSGLEFSNIGFKWATKPLDQISISGGTHAHLGDIVLYPSEPPVILNYNKIPDHQAIISIQHDYSGLFEYFELYISYYPDDSESRLLTTVTPGTTSITIKEEGDEAFVALKSIPYQGEISNYSPWSKIYFTDVIDPDAKMSFFEYNNYYSATLNWQSTGYETYYKGLMVAEENDTGFTFISPLLSVYTLRYNIQTSPGMTGNYYIIAITKTGSYNIIQPVDQKIKLEVPLMEFPSGFRGKFGTVGGINIKLLWEPIATNNTWYSGYLIEKKTITDTLEYNWEELTRITSSFAESYTDREVDTTNIYKYSIRTISYPSGLGSPEYSLPDSITVEPK